MNKRTYFLILSLWFGLTQTFPPFFFFIPLGQAVTLAIFMAGAGILFPRLLFRKSMLALYLFTLVNYLLYLSGNKFLDTPNSVIIPFLSMGTPLLLAEYAFSYDKDGLFVKRLVIVAMVCTIIMAVISIPQILLFPNVIRGASISSSVEDNSIVEDVSIYYWVINYGSIHGLSILIAPLAYFCRKHFEKKKLSSYFWMLSLLLIFIVIFLSSATTSLIIAIMMLFLGFFMAYKKLSREMFVKIGLVGFTGFVLSQPVVLIPVIDFTQSLMIEDSSNYIKMNQLRNSLKSGEAEGDAEARSVRYDASLDLFLDSPLMGTDRPESIGRHSFFLDRLALYGLILIIPLVLVIILNLRKMYKWMKTSKVPYFYGVAGSLLMLAFKGDFGESTWFYGFAFLPILCKYMDNIVNERYR